jgi:hypothetical protein
MLAENVPDVAIKKAPARSAAASPIANINLSTPVLPRLHPNNAVMVVHASSNAILTNRRPRA